MLWLETDEVLQSSQKIENTLSRAIERWLYLFAEQPKRDKTA